VTRTASDSNRAEPNPPHRPDHRGIDAHRAGPDWPFWGAIGAITGAYLLFLFVMLLATAMYTSPSDLIRALRSPEIQYATRLSLVTCTITSLLALALAIPVGYLMSRSHFRGKNVLETFVDVPIVLPPLVVGLCLLILFQTTAGRAVERFLLIVFKWIFAKLHLQGVENYVPFTYTVSGVVLAQFLIGAAFAVRQMRTTFDHLSSRPEDVAMTLGCSRGRAVWLVTLPAAKRGMFSAASVAWARSRGEFGPILVFAGATRMKTEVLPTTVWLELSVGHLEAAIAVSLMMVGLAIAVLLAMRAVGERP